MTVATWLTIHGSCFDLDFEVPAPEAVKLDDLAHHLSRLPSRWGGNIEFASYSAAQHTLVAATACRLLASRPYVLLLEAAFVFHADMGLEKRILAEAIYPAFNLPLPSEAIGTDVYNADQIALATEYRDVVKGKSDNWAPSTPALPGRIRFMPQAKVEEAFRKALEGALRPFGALAA